MNRDQALIKDEAERRGITRLCHLMQSRKLAHVLTDPGVVWSVARLKEFAPDLLDQMDKDRRDGHLDHICCSIEYPNTWYLNKVRHRDPLFKDWVVLLLSPSLLWQSGTLFSPRNAAAEAGALIRGGYNGFSQLYAPTVVGAGGHSFRRTPAMLPCCPTDDQAEVLIAEQIPQALVAGVTVPTIDAARVELGRLAFLSGAARTRWNVAPALFDGSWSAAVRRGQRPQETPCQEYQL
jgi:hypothetical protein